MIKERIREKIDSEKIFIGTIVLFVVLITATYLYFNKNSEIIGSKSKAKEEVPISRLNEMEVKPKTEEIKVYVVGAVNKPGVVILNKGQIIEDAVKLAGGFKSDADLQNINLVYKLNDNVMLKIRSKSENQPIPTLAAQNPPQGAQIITDSMGSVEARTTVNSGSNTSGAAKIVNINTATKEELRTLTGVGPSTADKIMQYREKNQSFKTKDELKKVPGIGDSKYNSIKDFIVVN